MNRILGKADDLDTEPAEMVVPYEVNDSVKVKDGPFSGFSGVVQEVNKEKKTVTVSVMVFGRSQPLTLGFMQVEKE